MWHHLLLNTKKKQPLSYKIPLQHVMKHMNLQPLESHGVDFSRVRMWNLNNWAKHYRQTLVFSSIQDPQINSIVTKHCANYRGQVPHRCRDWTFSTDCSLFRHISQRQT